MRLMKLLLIFVVGLLPLMGKAAGDYRRFYDNGIGIDVPASWGEPVQVYSKRGARKGFKLDIKDGAWLTVVVTHYPEFTRRDGIRAKLDEYAHLDFSWNLKNAQLFKKVVRSEPAEALRLAGFEGERIRTSFSSGVTRARAYYAKYIDPVLIVVSVQSSGEQADDPTMTKSLKHMLSSIRLAAPDQRPKVFKGFGILFHYANSWIIDDAGCDRGTTHCNVGIKTPGRVADEVDGGAGSTTGSQIYVSLEVNPRFSSGSEYRKIQITDGPKVLVHVNKPKVLEKNARIQAELEYLLGSIQAAQKSAKKEQR